MTNEYIKKRAPTLNVDQN